MAKQKSTSEIERLRQEVESYRQRELEVLQASLARAYKEIEILKEDVRTIAVEANHRWDVAKELDERHTQTIRNLQEKLREYEADKFNKIRSRATNGSHTRRVGRQRG